jgi:hypothetical protein
MKIGNAILGLAVGVLLCSGSARGATGNMSDEMLTSLLVAQHRSDFYVDLLAGQNPRDVVFKAITVPSFRDGSFYLCMLVKPGLNEHHFAIFVDSAGKQVTVLTQSTEGLGVVLRAQRGLNFAAIDKRALAADLLSLYRPNYVRVEPLDATAIKGGAAQGMDIRLGKETEPSVSKDGAELATNWVLREGRDLVVTNLKASTAGSVEIAELVRVKNAFVSTSSHD